MKINKEYREITQNILNDENYKLLKNDTHHGTNKYDHCKRVSYLSFLMAKVFKGNTEEVARAGLLHDFFFGGRTEKEENSYFSHPLTSARNAKEYFNIEDSEVKIIESHMYHYALVRRVFPFLKKEDKEYFSNYKPKNKDSVIVCVSDLLISFFEVCAFKVRYSVSLYIIFLINIMRY